MCFWIRSVCIVGMLIDLRVTSSEGSRWCFTVLLYGWFSSSVHAQQVFHLPFATTDTDKLQSALTPTQRIALSDLFYSVDSSWNIPVVSLLTFILRHCSVLLFYLLTNVESR